MANEALFVQGGSYDAAELRKLISGIYTAAPPGGVITGLEVTAGVGANVTVAAGYGYVTDGAGGGYMGAKAASTSLALTGFSGSPRTDRVYARILDPGAGPTAGEMEINKAQGSTTIPTLSIPLADVTVNAGGVTVSAAPRVEASVAGSYDAVAELDARMDALETRNISGGTRGHINNVYLGSYANGNPISNPVQLFGTEQPIDSTYAQLTLAGRINTFPPVGSMGGTLLYAYGFPAPLVSASGLIIGAGWSGTGNYVAQTLSTLFYSNVSNTIFALNAPNGTFGFGAGIYGVCFINATYVAQRSSYTWVPD